MLTLLTILAIVCFAAPILGYGYFWPAASFWTPWALIGFPLLYIGGVLLLGGTALLVYALPIIAVVALAAVIARLIQYFAGRHGRKSGSSFAA